MNCKIAIKIYFRRHKTIKDFDQGPAVVRKMASSVVSEWFRLNRAEFPSNSLKCHSSSEPYLWLFSPEYQKFWISIFPLPLSQVVSQDSYVAVSSFELSRVSFLKVQSDKVNRDRNQPGASKWLKNLP